MTWLSDGWAVAAVLALLVQVCITTGSQNDSASLHPILVAAKPGDVVNMGDLGSDPLAALVRAGKPVVLHNLPASWTASTEHKKWDFSEATEKRFPVINVKRTKANRIRYYNEGQAMDSTVFKHVYNATFEKGYEDVVLPGKQVFQQFRNPSDGYRYYLGAPVEEIKSIHVTSDIGNLSAFFHQSRLAPKDLQQEPQVNLWMGSGSLAADLHYDSTENVYLPLHGRKRFRLLPPSVLSAAQLFPSLHPHYRQAKADIDELSRTFSDLLVDVTIGSGEALFLPAFWLHYVSQEDSTISVNVWSYSDNFFIAERLFTQPIPLDDEWSIARLLVATRVFLQAFIATALPGKTHGLAEHWCTQRFPPLSSRAIQRLLRPESNRWVHCMEDEEDDPNSLSIEFAKRSPDEKQEEGFVEEEEEEEEDDGHERQDKMNAQLRGDLKAKGRALGEIALAFSDPAITQVYVGNFIEQVVYRAFGIVHVQPFICNCM